MTVLTHTHQGVGAVSAASLTLTVTTTVNIPIGDTAFGIIGYHLAGGLSTITCADNATGVGAANVWTTDKQQSNTGASGQLVVFRTNVTRAIVPGRTITFTWGTSLSSQRAGAVVFSTHGWTVPAAVTFSGSTSNTPASMTTPSVGPTTVPDSFVLTAYGFKGTASVPAYTETSGKTAGIGGYGAAGTTGGGCRYSWTETSVAGLQSGSATLTPVATQAWTSIILTYTAASGTIFTKSITGAALFAGVRPKVDAQRKLPGALAFAGSEVAHPTARRVSASFSPTGSLSSAAARLRSLVGAVFAPVGALSKAAARFRTLTGAVFTPTGVNTRIKSVSKAVSGALSFSGAQTRFPAKVLTAQITATGLVGRTSTLARTLVVAFLAPTTRTDIGIIVPAFANPSPTTVWDGWISGAPNVKMMIANPSNGPGVSAVPAYTAAIAHAQANGIRILGYVDTASASIGVFAVETQVDAWLSLYGVADIFFDHASTLTGDLAYYQTLGDYVHGHGGIAMLNPGANPVEGYFNGMADVICVFQGDQTSYDSYAPPSFITKYPASMVAHFVYNVPSVVFMDQDVNKAIRSRAGYAYITDDTTAFAGPFDAVPSYWTQELAVTSTGFTKRTSRKLLGAAQSVGMLITSSRGALTASFRPTGTVTHGLPARTLFAGLALTGSVARFTTRQLVASLIASGVIHTQYIPPVPAGSPGGGGFGALMSDAHFSRYKVSAAWRGVKRVKA